MSYEDFVGTQATIRAFQATKDFITDEVLKPTEEEKEDGETDE